MKRKREPEGSKEKVEDEKDPKKRKLTEEETTEKIEPESPTNLFSSTPSKEGMGFDGKQDFEFTFASTYPSTATPKENKRFISQELDPSQLFQEEQNENKQFEAINELKQMQKEERNRKRKKKLKKKEERMKKEMEEKGEHCYGCHKIIPEGKAFLSSSCCHCRTIGNLWFHRECFNKKYRLIVKQSDARFDIVYSIFRTYFFPNSDPDDPRYARLPAIYCNRCNYEYGYFKESKIPLTPPRFIVPFVMISLLFIVFNVLFGMVLMWVLNWSLVRTVLSICVNVMFFMGRLEYFETKNKFIFAAAFTLQFVWAIEMYHNRGDILLPQLTLLIMMIKRNIPSQIGVPLKNYFSKLSILLTAIFGSFVAYWDWFTTDVFRLNVLVNFIKKVVLPCFEFGFFIVCVVSVGHIIIQKMYVEAAITILCSSFLMYFVASYSHYNVSFFGILLMLVNLHELFSPIFVALVVNFVVYYPFTFVMSILFKNSVSKKYNNYLVRKFDVL